MNMPVSRCLVEGCDWDTVAPEGPLEYMWKGTTVLHVLFKHPKVYMEKVGKSPEEGLAEYEETIAPHTFESMKAIALGKEEDRAREIFGDEFIDEFLSE